MAGAEMRTVAVRARSPSSPAAATAIFVRNAAIGSDDLLFQGQLIFWLWLTVVFGNFAEALAFVNKVGEIAEAADHHPDIKFGWGYAKIETTTHDRDGVTDHDLALAKQIDDLSKTATTS